MNLTQAVDLTGAARYDAVRRWHLDTARALSTTGQATEPTPDVVQTYIDAELLRRRITGQQERSAA